MSNKLELLKQVKDMKFKYLRISLTKDCNGACSFCHNEGQMIGKRGDKATPVIPLLSIEDYDYIAKFFRTTMQSVSFTGGEPTLVENLPEIVEVFKRNGYKTSMTTNGFALTPELQERLSEAGLDKINVSVPSLDEDEYDKMFGVKGKLPIVLRNLESLSKTFKDKCKINFMALKDINCPSQLIPLSRLSGRLGIPISFLTVLDNTTEYMSNYVLQFLKEHIGVKDINVKEGKFGTKTIYELSNGSKWEFDDFRDSEYRKEAFNNQECSNCSKKDQCVEGPYALRIGEDGVIRKCLIRKDNLVYLKKEGYYNDR